MIVETVDVCGRPLALHRQTVDGHELPFWSCGSPGCTAAAPAWGPRCPGRHTVGLLRPWTAAVRGLENCLVWWCADCHRAARSGGDLTQPKDTAKWTPSRRYAPGELVHRRARHRWVCEGKGYPPDHAPDCPLTIEAGDRYVEMMPGALAYFDSSRFSVACASLHWGFVPGGPSETAALQARVRLTRDSIEEAYLDLGACLDLFPETATGRPAAATPVALCPVGAPDVVRATIGARGRTPAHGAWRRFFDAHRAKEGDWLVVSRLSEHRFLLDVEPGSTVIATPAGEPRTELVPVERQQVTTAIVERPAQVTPIRRAEQTLVLALQAHLEAEGHEAVRLRVTPPGESTPLYSDLYDKTTNTLFEAKSSADRTAIRMAIGQLADYRRFLPQPRCAILVPEPPNDDLMALLEREGIAAVWPVDGGFSLPHEETVPANLGA